MGGISRDASNTEKKIRGTMDVSFRHKTAFILQSRESQLCTGHIANVSSTCDGFLSLRDFVVLRGIAVVKAFDVTLSK